MKLEAIISLANKKCETEFLAMERSLRATGCNLPLLVIPYDHNLFELPSNSTWWDIPEISKWIDHNKLWPAFKKIQCLTIANYQFVDSDVIFFQNPSLRLNELEGFVSSCTHWNNPGHTYTLETLQFLRKKSTTWPKLVFNSGQWACDRQLYETNELIDFCERNFVETLFKNNYIYKDQAGINLLVNYKDVSIINLTLPPYNMESTWAGDYLENDSFERFEINDKPYLIHWAGIPIRNNQNINSYFFKYLTCSEVSKFKGNPQSILPVLYRLKGRFKNAYQFVKSCVRLYVNISDKTKRI